SWHGLPQGRGHLKRMPEDDPLHVPRAAAQQNAKGFRAVRGVQDQSMLRRELARGLALDRRRAVAAAQTVHDVGGAGSRERYAHASEQAPRPPGQPRGPPAIGDERRSDAHTDHARGPAEPGDTEQQTGDGAAGAERRHDRIGRIGELSGELQGCKEMADDSSRVRAARGNPAPGPESPGAAPRAEQRHRQGGTGCGPHDQRGVCLGRRGHRAARRGLGLRKLSEGGAAGERRRMHRGGEAVGRARAAHGHEHAPRRRACKQEFEAAHLVPAVARRGAVLALDPERLHTERARERRSTALEGRGPLPQTTGRERRTYLSVQSLRIGHCQPSAGGSRCGFRPITSATPRAPPANARVTRWGALPSRLMPSSTRRWRRRSRRSRPAWSSWARKSEPRRTPSCIATSGRPRRWRRASPRSGASRWSGPTRRRRASTAIATAISSSSSPVATAARRSSTRSPCPTSRPCACCSRTTPSRRYSTTRTTTCAFWTGITGFARRGCSTRASRPSSLAFRRGKGARALGPSSRAALRELYGWREVLAAEQDKATFRIIGNDALVAVAKALPRTAAELALVPQLPATLARRHGPALLESVRRALALAEAELPRIERSARPPKDAAFDGRVERLKAARNRVAAEFGLDPGVLCGRSTLEAVARTTPTPNDRAGLSRVAELRRWQIEVLGNALLAALA